MPIKLIARVLLASAILVGACSGCTTPSPDAGTTCPDTAVAGAACSVSGLLCNDAQFSVCACAGGTWRCPAVACPATADAGAADAGTVSCEGAATGGSCSAPGASCHTMCANNPVGNPANVTQVCTCCGTTWQCLTSTSTCQ